MVELVTSSFRDMCVPTLPPLSVNSIHPSTQKDRSVPSLLDIHRLFTVQHGRLDDTRVGAGLGEPSNNRPDNKEAMQAISQCPKDT